MSWDRLATTPEFVLYRDAYGNIRLRSTVTGRFVPEASIAPDYGAGGYGQTFALDVG
jgi:hypothetical protein